VPDISQRRGQLVSQLSWHFGAGNRGTGVAKRLRQWAVDHQPVPVKPHIRFRRIRSLWHRVFRRWPILVPGWAGERRAITSHRRGLCGQARLSIVWPRRMPSARAYRVRRRGGRRCWPVTGAAPSRGNDEDQWPWEQILTSLVLHRGVVVNLPRRPAYDVRGRHVARYGCF
jgi:hypothetical protein